MTTTCPSGKKWSLPSEEVANNLATLLGLAIDDGVTRRSYKCPHCPDWHVTRRVQPDDDTEEDDDAA